MPLNLEAVGMFFSAPGDLFRQLGDQKGASVPQGWEVAGAGPIAMLAACSDT